MQVHSRSPRLGIKYRMKYEFSDMTFDKFKRAINYLCKMENEDFLPSCMLYNDNLTHVDMFDLSQLCLLANKKLKIH